MARKKTKSRDHAGNGESSFADDFLNSIDKEKILNNAQDIINSAINVLEEEIAAGILAAKNIEKEMIDVDNIRNNPDDLMNRIRRDTHEAVDLFIDALTAITKHVSTLSSTLDVQNSGTEKANTSNGKEKDSSVSFIEAETPLKPGESTTLSLNVFDGEADEPIDLSIQKTEFKGPNKQFIWSRAIKIEPAELTLKPGEEKEISVQINIPKNAEPGKYNTMLTDANNHDFRAVIGIEVME